MVNHDMDRTQLETDEAPTFGYLDDEAFEGQLSPAEQLALASELLEVTDEEELEEFLGGVLNKAAGAVRRFASSPRGRAVTGYLKSALKQALPSIGRAVGNRIVPGGGDVGANLATGLADALGLEMEGLSAEDEEFAASRQLVRMAAAAARHASRAPRDTDPDEAGRAAVEAAIRQFAPGLAIPSEDAAPGQALSPLSEEEEDELADEFLEIGNEDELERFVSKVIRTAHSKPAPHPHADHPHAARKPGAARQPRKQNGSFLRSSAAKALGGALKQVAKAALPSVGSAIGDMVLPGIGGAIGGDLGSALSNLFEVGEMPQEEAEMEGARRFVRLAAGAAHDLANSPDAAASPRTAAWDSVLNASRNYAPGLHRRLLGQPGNGHRRRRRHERRLAGYPAVIGEPVTGIAVDREPAESGTWERRGDQIILLRV